MAAIESHTAWAERIAWVIFIGSLCAFPVKWLGYGSHPWEVATWFLALTALIILTFWHSFLKFDFLHEKLAQKFSVSVGTGPDVLNPSKVRTVNNYFQGQVVIAAIPACYFRIIVTTNGLNQINDCTGFLTKIEYAGRVMMNNENIQLTYANGRDPDTHAKIIRPGLLQYLDVLVIERHEQYNQTIVNISSLSVPNSVAVQDIFSEFGDYLLYVTLVGSGVPHLNIKLRFNWTGNMDTSEIFLLS